MTDEEYLTARGWTPRKDGWDPPPRPTVGPTHDVYFAAWATPRAVKAQLAEDRACYNFVRERSDIENGLLVARR